MSKKANAGILIICHEFQKLKVAESLARLSGANWDSDGKILLLGIPFHLAMNRDYISSQVNSIANRNKGAIIALFGLETKFQTTDFNPKVFIGKQCSFKSMIRSLLPSFLKNQRLDWLSKISDRLKNSWFHARVKDGHIEDWLKQFDRIGSYRWVGENILRALDYWSEADVLEAFNITQEGVADFESICINSLVLGKSSGIVGNILQKQIDGQRLPVKRVVDFVDALEDQNISKILVLEDCLLSGTETVGVFKSVLGIPKLGKAKARQVKDPTTVKTKKIELRYAVATNYGLAVVKKFFSQVKIENVEIKFSHSIKCLTDSGIDELNNDRLFDANHCLTAPERNIKRMVFDAISIWKDEKNVKLAISLCTDIGSQLWRQLGEKLQWDFSFWPESRIQQCGLGMDGLALGLAFAHSVPKASLPILWMGGGIQFNGKPINWIPLFPNAA